MIYQVSATDADAKNTPNSRITYSINRKQSDSKRTFSIEPTTGLIVLSRKLNFEQARVHEIVVVARDGGEVKKFHVEYNYAIFFCIIYTFLLESFNLFFTNRYRKRQVRLLLFA